MTQSKALSTRDTPQGKALSDHHPRGPSSSVLLAKFDLRYCLAMSPTAATPRWKLIADGMERLLAGPTPHQLATAASLSVTLPANLPAPVATTVLHWHITDPDLRDSSTSEIPFGLVELENSLGLSPTEQFITDSRAELNAWFAARFMLKTLEGLRSLQPVPGDVVHQMFRSAGDDRIVSSIGRDGRVHFKGRPSGRAWPNNLTMVARVGSSTYAAVARATANARLNAVTSTTTNLQNFDGLNGWALGSVIPSPQAIRALEDLLESGEMREEKYQQTITAHPELLGALVIGNWRTYVIPKPRLGGEYVPDYLVLGINSHGPNWVLVEIESPRHQITNQDGSLSTPTRHAVGQINDWREWLLNEVSYVQGQGYVGLTTRSHGVVIIGRDDPSPTHANSRVRTEWENRIAVHSWDWLLRSAKNFSQNNLQVTDIAVDVERDLNADALGTSGSSLDILEAMRPTAMTITLDEDDSDSFGFDALFDESSDELEIPDSL